MSRLCQCHDVSQVSSGLVLHTVTRYEDATLKCPLAITRTGHCSMRQGVFGTALPLVLQGALSKIDDEHFILRGSDAKKNAGYLSTLEFINRPHLGVVFRSIYKDGTILLDDPHIDKVPAYSVRRVVCAQTVEFDGLSKRTLLCQ